MAIYSLSQRTTNTTIANAAWSIISSATNKPKVMELGISQNTGTATSWGLGRPSSAGVTPTTPVNFLDEQDGAAPTANTTACLAWTTQPGAPANFLRRVSTPATIGAGIIWTFPRGLAIPISSNLVVWNITASVASDCWAVIDE